MSTVKSVFVTHSDEDNDIVDSVTFTNVLDTLPKNCLSHPVKDWRKNSNTEWRWRFLKFTDNRSVVEISYVKNGEKRMYYSKNKEWVHRDIPDFYNEYVHKELYYYT